MPSPTLSNVITGGATLYTAAASTAMPANTVLLGAAWPVGWTYVGATDSGVTFGVNKNTQDRVIDEQSIPVGIDTLTTDVTVAVTLAEDTIENMKLVFGGTLTVNSGATPPNKVLTLADPLLQFAVGFEGLNALGKARRVYIPISVVSGQVAVPYQRVASKRMYAVTFRAICDPTTISITDVTG